MTLDLPDRLTAQAAIQQVLTFDAQEHPNWRLTTHARIDLNRMLRTLGTEITREMGS